MYFTQRGNELTSLRRELASFGFNTPYSSELGYALISFVHFRVVTLMAHSGVAAGRLSLVQAKCRTGEPLHYGDDFFKAASGASEGIEALEADQGIEDIDRLVECLGCLSLVLLGKSLDDDTKTLSPPFVACSDHLLKVRIECSQTAEPTRH
jgi:hypothetical protein